MTDEKADTANTVPYASWLTFKRFVGELAKKSMPNRIDHTVMSGKSGGTQSTLRGALRFLELTDGDLTPTEEFRGLVAAYDKGSQWEEVLRPIVMKAYARIVDGLDLKRGTAHQLAECFRKRGKVSGNTLTMAVRFYLNALDDADIERSPYFAAPKRPARKKQAKAPPQEKNSSSALPASPAEETTVPGAKEAATDWPSHPFHIPTRSQPVIVTAPKDLTEQEWVLIDTFMRGMIALAPTKTLPEIERD